MNLFLHVLFEYLSLSRKFEPKLIGYMYWHDFYRVDYFVHVLFSVILVEFIAIFTLSC